MQIGGVQIFKNKDAIDVLIILSKQGASLTEMSRHFKCHHTSVRYQLIKLGIPLPKRQIYISTVVHKKRKAGFCPNCEMKIDSPYHIKYPCQ